MRTALLVALCAVAMSIGLSAQNRRIASPPGTSATEVGGQYDERLGYIGGRWMEIRYGRPIRRGRDLFGPSDYPDALSDGAPVWRAGANVSTRLMTEVPIVIGNKTIAPGEYSLFIDLTPKQWTLIVSTWPAQIEYDTRNKAALWGAYEYTPDKDVVRAPMTREKLSHSFDQLSWEFLDVNANGGRMAIIWDNQLAFVPFRFAR
jgi:Protein of unknown function (DUF2911)